MLALGVQGGTHRLAGHSARIKLQNLEDSLCWTAACFPVLNNLSVLCFSSLALLCESHLGIFSKCSTFSFSSGSGMRRNGMFDGVLGHLPVLLLGSSPCFDLIHKLVRHSLDSPVRPESVSLLRGNNHLSSPRLPGLGHDMPMVTNALGE